MTLDPELAEANKENLKKNREEFAADIARLEGIETVSKRDAAVAATSDLVSKKLQIVTGGVSTLLGEIGLPPASEEPLLDKWLDEYEYNSLVTVIPSLTSEQLEVLLGKLNPGKTYKVS